jgi:hypothetical protein
MIIISTFCCLVISGHTTNVLGLLAIAYRDFFKSSDFQFGLLGFIFFLSKILGTFFTGSITSKVDRICLQKICIIIILFIKLINAIWWNNYKFLLISKIFGGFLAGIKEVI